MGEGTGKGKKRHSEELHGVHSVPNTTGAIESRRMRWVGHVTRVGFDGECKR